MKSAQQSRGVLRRPDRVHGRALEVLGHAIEYVVDSRLKSDECLSAETQAAVMLMSARSREVFAECPEVIGLATRFTRWFGWPFASVHASAPSVRSAPTKNATLALDHVVLPMTHR